MLYLLAFIVGGLLGALMMAVVVVSGKNVKEIDDARRQQRSRDEEV